MVSLEEVRCAMASDTAEAVEGMTHEMYTVRRVVGPESVPDAARLLSRFFMEEGFQTPLALIGERLEALVADKDNAVFLAERDGEMVGVATVTASLGIEFGKSAEIGDLYVAPAARATGAGRALIEAARQWSEQESCTSLEVVVTPEGQVAHDLLGYYARRGFRDSGRHILYLELAGGV